MTERPPLHRSFDLARLAFVPAAIGLLLAFIPLEGAAYWWDVALGQLLAGFHAIPTHDPFSFLSAETEIFVQPWIGQFWLYSLHELSGLAGTLVLRNLAVMATFGVLALLSYYRNGRNGVASMAWCTALGVVFALFVARTGTDLFVWPLTAAAMALGFAIRYERLPRWTALGFPLLAAFWVNLAPRFLVAALVPAILAVIVLRDRRRALWFGVAAMLSILATAAHPAGFEVLQHMRMPGRVDVGLALLAATTLDVRVFPFVGERAPVGASRLAVIPLAAAILMVAVAAQPWTTWHGQALASVRSDTVRSSPPYAGWMPANVPVKAVELLGAWGSRPRVFVDYEHSGYVAYELGRTGPAQHTVLLSPWSGERGRTLFQQVLDTPSAAPGIFQQLGVHAAILDPARHGVLVEQLREATGWEAVLETSDSVLFIRRQRQREDT